MKKNIALLPFLPSTAFAHSGFQGEDFITGLLHPFTGLDHLSAMLGVGIVAAIIGGKRLWQLPLSFITFMLIGALLMVTGVAFGPTEILIATSVLSVGLMIVFSKRLKFMTQAVTALVMFFALSHGYAHALEMQIATSTLLYFTGFVVATALLNILGGLLGHQLIHFKLDCLAFKVIGSAMAILGGALLVS